jgi:solute carrier family 35 protein F1/2
MAPPFSSQEQIRFEALETETSEAHANTNASIDDSSSSTSNSNSSDYRPYEPSQPERRQRLISTIVAKAVTIVTADWKILVFGQALSFLLAASGAAQATLALDCNLSAPIFEIGLCYAVLSLNIIPLYLKGRRQLVTAATTTSDQTVGVLSQQPVPAAVRPPHSFLGILPLQAPACAYLGMAVMDVYANYFTLLAFKYTTITSVTVFDALAIPSAMILSRCFLARKYTAVHLAGVVTCCIGIVVNVLQDYEDDTTQDNSDEDKAYPHKLRGDFLAITGGILFGANNVLQEVSVRNFGGIHEYLGMLGFFATAICAIQTLCLERDALADFFGNQESKSETCSQKEARWLLVGYVVSISLIYTGVSHFLQISESTFLNLSFLTGDLWSVLFSVVAEHIVPKPLFFAALVFIVSGVFVYELAPSPILDHKDSDDEDDGNNKSEQDDEWRDLSNELELQNQNGNLS